MKVFFPVVFWTIRLLLMGDSMTVGFPYDPGFREYIRGYETVGSQPGGHEGHGGWWAKGGPEGGIIAHAAEWTKAHNPEVIFILAGANDILGGEGDPQAIQDIYAKICEQKTNTRVLVGTLPIIRGYEAEVKEFNRGLRELLQDKAEIVELETVLGPSDYYLDGLHPNKNGYRLIGEALGKALESAQK